MTSNPLFPYFPLKRHPYVAAEVAVEVFVVVVAVVFFRDRYGLVVWLLWWRKIPPSSPGQP
jgi:hypothetical protein